VTFNDWLSDHRDEIVPEAASPEEIANLLAVVDRELGDSESARSLDGRFVHAYWACLTVARTALRACGYRLRSVAGHVRTIESLEHTMEVDQGSRRQLHTFRTKRARADYEMVDTVSGADLEEASRLAEELREKLHSWLMAEHPDLIA
jgi:hypothetical protein